MRSASASPPSSRGLAGAHALGLRFAAVVSGPRWGSGARPPLRRRRLGASLRLAPLVAPDGPAPPRGGPLEPEGQPRPRGEAPPPAGDQEAAHRTRVAVEMPGPAVDHRRMDTAGVEGVDGGGAGGRDGEQPL